MISEKPVRLHSWGRSLVEPPKNKLLISHDINCFNDVCIINKENTYVDKVYILQKDQKLVLCNRNHIPMEEAAQCFEKSKHLSKIIKAFCNSGYNYLFNYSVIKLE